MEFNEEFLKTRIELMEKFPPPNLESYYYKKGWMDALNELLKMIQDGTLQSK
ncbi:hypothetical protein [Bacillus thuringiensis]|uniref:hypothetical protein n=1 Tax=Bacillus thuringiensis TaxID=1428 RepID=UPI0015D5089F|nr:hypothetical protein [Bacillus thuringiensis]